VELQHHADVIMYTTFVLGIVLCISTNILTAALFALHDFIHMYPVFSIRGPTAGQFR